MLILPQVAQNGRPGTAEFEHDPSEMISEVLRISLSWRKRPLYC